MAALFEAHIIVIRHTVVAMQDEPFVQKEFCKVKTDKPSCACDKDASQRPLRIHRRCGLAEHRVNVAPYRYLRLYKLYYFLYRVIFYIIFNTQYNL